MGSGYLLCKFRNDGLGCSGMTIRDSSAALRMTIRDPSAALRMTALIVGVVVFSFVAVVAVRWGIADRRADVTYQEMRVWAKEGVSEESWIIAHDAMLEAIELDPSNPAYLHRLGRLSVIRMSMKRNQRSELGREGLDYFERSILVRDQWPPTWSSLASLKHRLGEHDARFNEAFVNATTYGPWEPGVHSQIAGVGVGAWKTLPEEARAALLGNIDRGLRSPVGGAPGAVVDAIKANMLGADVDFVRRLGTLLAELEWLARSRPALADLSLSLWDIFSLDQRRILAQKVADVAALGRNVNLLKRLEREGRMSSICPLLPRNQKFARFCNDKS